VMADLLA